MDTLQLTLPEKLKAFIESEAAARGHPSAHDYVLAILKEAQKKRAWEKAEKLVIEGLDSGDPMPMDDAFWEEMHRKLRERYPEIDNP
jgi:antitoxin ParD1/3/4